jgi:nicotinate-nucleotide pyrophosphorylase (carboxylating)
MSAFTEAELAACRKLVELALAEDFGEFGDRTSRCLIPTDKPGNAAFVARSQGVLAGLPAVAEVIRAVDPSLKFEVALDDGSDVPPDTVVAVVLGPLRSILALERTALNFVQRLSGVATLTRKFVDAVQGTPAVILDTRKTTPGWRRLEKYAVRMGGGTNHRMGLYDGILIKDNHLAGLGSPLISVTRAIELARADVSNELYPVEVEVDTLDQLDHALAAKVDIVLLDNMRLPLMKMAVERRNATSPGTKLEASGGVTLDTVRAIAETGVDRISIGALTHSAAALDIALDYIA